MISWYPGAILAAAGLFALITASIYCAASTLVVTALVIVGFAVAVICAEAGRARTGRQP